MKFSNKVFGKCNCHYFLAIFCIFVAALGDCHVVATSCVLYRSSVHVIYCVSPKPPSKLNSRDWNSLITYVKNTKVGYYQTLATAKQTTSRRMSPPPATKNGQQTLWWLAHTCNKSAEIDKQIVQLTCVHAVILLRTAGVTMLWQKVAQHVYIWG